MSYRIIKSKKQKSSGLLYHYCPMNGEKLIGAKAGCSNLLEYHENQASYKITCGYPQRTPFEPAVVADSVPPGMGDDTNASRFALNDWSVCEPKLDGVRNVIEFDESGHIHFYTKRTDKYGDQPEITDHFPHVSGIVMPELAGTRLDSEVMVVQDNRGMKLEDTMSVVGGYADSAIKNQMVVGKAHWFIFAAMNECGEDITGLSWNDMQAWMHLSLAMNLQGHIYFHIVTPWMARDTKAKRLLFCRFTTNGVDIDGIHLPTEGMVIKHPEMSYFEPRAMIKIKESFSITTLITGYDLGSAGKYENTIGALRVSVVDMATNSLREICKVAPGSDAIRNELFQALSGADDIAALGMCVEVEGQNWTKEYRIRHPKVMQYRMDISIPDAIDFSGIVRK